jgi:hypothetical protein
MPATKVWVVTTAGYPITDSLTCQQSADGSCRYQLFEKNYALFDYTNPILAGQNFTAPKPGDIADGTYSIKAVAGAKVQLSRLSGDGQVARWLPNLHSPCVF